MSQAPVTTRRYIPALGRIWDGLSDFAYPIVRIATGAMLIPHGIPKLFGGAAPGTAQFFTKMGLEPALPLVYYIGALEFFGGILLILGLLTRLVAIQVVGFMLVAVVVAHWANGFFWTKGGYEYPLLLMILGIVILIRGGGRYSVDSKLGREF